MVESSAGEKPKRTYPSKLVTFPNEERRERATKYCEAMGIGFAELCRKLLDAHMKTHPAASHPEAPATIRVIQEPGQ